MLHYDEVSGSYVKNQEEADKNLESYILGTMKQGEKEEYMRQKHIDEMRALGIKVVSVPNKRSEAQKVRWAKVREEKRLSNINNNLAEKLADGWNCNYNNSNRGEK